MVSPELIKASNERIKSTLPPGLVAVFLGGTNGIGETTLKQFAKYTAQPRVYIVGRSQDAGDRITAECKTLNPEGTFIFMQKEVHLMRNVDEVCKEIAGKEEAINLLFITVGTLQIGIETEEGLHYEAALTIYARSRFISNLLPLVRNAQGLRRIVSTFGATFEGNVDMDDFQSSNLSRPRAMGQKASITTLSLEAQHQVAPEVSFIHNFPGAVVSGIARGNIGPFMRFLKTVWAWLGPLVHIPLEEAGDRHLFLCTSARFPAGPNDATAGVPPPEGLDVATGIDGEVGSGVYSINEKGDSSGANVEHLMTQFREQGMVARVWKKIESDIRSALATGKDGLDTAG